MKKILLKLNIVFLLCLLFSLFSIKDSFAQAVPLKSSLIDSETPFVLAVEKDYPPFLFVDQDGQVKGIAYEYAMLIAEKMGKDLQLTEALQLQQMLDAVKEGRANLLADITKTPERLNYLAFSESFVETQAVVISRKGALVKWDDDLNKGLKIAVGKGYGVISFLKNKYPDAIFLELNSDSEVVKSVAFGTSDVGVLDVVSLSYLLQTTPLFNIEVVAETDFNYSLAFAVPIDNKSIIPAINRAIESITLDEKAAIYDQWISSLPQKNNSIIPKYVYILFVGLLIIILALVIISTIFRRLVLKKNREVNYVNSYLDSLVQEKVKEINNLKSLTESKNIELLNTQKAILNVLSDIQQDKENITLVSSRLDLATQSAKIGVWEWDVKKNLLTANKEFYEHYHASEKDFKKAYEAWFGYIHPEDRSDARKNLEDALKSKDRFDLISRVVLLNNEVKTFHFLGNVKRDEEGRPLQLTGVLIDISKESEVDKQKTEFVSLASHQLRTPVGAISWNLEMLLAGDYGQLSDKQKEILQESYTLNMRMNELVNALLNVSRLETGVFIIEPKPIDFVKLCEEVLVEMKNHLENKGHKLTKNFDKNIPFIPADGKLLRIIFQNFISNAIKYTQDKGKIKVSLSMDERNVTFSVANNGEPIPQEDQSKIFTKMFRASNAQEQDPDGTGLGLYVVKKIAENGGGKIWFTSKKGEDTVFFCSFPLSGMIAKSGSKQLS